MSYELDPRRHFSRREKWLMYVRAKGKCEEPGCANPLSHGWHADHIIPHSRGGRTILSNGRATCPPCNLRKGAQMSERQYGDKFSPRKFQKGLLERVEEGIASGRKVTIAEVAAGSGKTLAAIAAATKALRDRQGQHYAAFTPRKTLNRQVEEGYAAWQKRGGKPILVGKDRELFDPACRIEYIRALQPPINPPLTDGPRQGFVGTYASLTTTRRPGARTQTSWEIYLEWARAHAGDFILVCDEAQFLGSSRESLAQLDSSEELAEECATIAAQRIRELSKYALHVIIMTATPVRSDGLPLVLCEDYYTEPDTKGVRYLKAHVTATYQDGVRDKYLRQYRAPLNDFRYTIERFHDGHLATESLLLSQDADKLKALLRLEIVWKTIVDNTVRELRLKQRDHRRYAALIACIEQMDAERVTRYLREEYPDLRVRIAISKDGTEAQSALRDFTSNKSDAGDILVTVGMAYIGYDCPRITVVGILTNIRFMGYLAQLCGRGTRVWSPEECGLSADDQSVVIVAPDDPLMVEFLTWLDKQSRQGIRERQGDGPGPGPGPGSSSTSRIADTEDAGENVHLPGGITVPSYEWNALTALAEQIGWQGDLLDLKELLDLSGFTPPGADAAAHDAESDDVSDDDTVVSGTDLAAKVNADTESLIRSKLHQAGYFPRASEYQKTKAMCTAWVNRRAGITTDQVNGDPVRAQRRYEAALSLNVHDALLS